MKYRLVYVGGMVNEKLAWKKNITIYNSQKPRALKHGNYRILPVETQCILVSLKDIILTNDF